MNVLPYGIVDELLSYIGYLAADYPILFFFTISLQLTMPYTILLCIISRISSKGLPVN